MHLQHVFSDVDGDSAQRLICAILAGERAMRPNAPGCATTAAARPSRKVIEALHGDYRDEYLFVLRQCQQRWAQIKESIAACAGEIGRLTAAIQRRRPAERAAARRGPQTPAPRGEEQFGQAHLRGGRALLRSGS